jgi:hypothetical protein
MTLLIDTEFSGEFLDVAHDCVVAAVLLAEVGGFPACLYPTGRSPYEC